MAIKNPNVLSILGRRITVRPSERAILACLHDNLGFAVPYKKLCTLGYGSGAVTRRRKQALRQTMLMVRRRLDKHKVRCVLAAIPRFGYAMFPLRKRRMAR